MSFPLQTADSSLQMFTRKFIEFTRLQAEAQKHQTNDLPKVVNPKGYLILKQQRSLLLEL